MADNPPEGAPKPTACHIALAESGHLQRAFRLQMKAEMLKRKVGIMSPGLPFAH